MPVPRKEAIYCLVIRFHDTGSMQAINHSGKLPVGVCSGLQESH